MKILLVDVDSKIPNLALMKLSSFHKNLGNGVDLAKLNISYYPNRRKFYNINASNYDRVFVSSIFFDSLRFLKIIGCNYIEYGGSGYSLEKTLSDDIFNLEPDYSLYPENAIFYGFITRGCVRNCSFCIVPAKEGKIQFIKHPKDIINHDKVKFLDNNILAYSNHKNILSWLVSNKITYCFNQGLDIRLLDAENSELLANSRYFGDYIFAFDYIKLEKVISEKLSLFREHFKGKWKIKFYLFCHPNIDISDVVYRVEWCRSNNVLPYLMRHLDCWDNDNTKFYNDLAAYCNQPNIFKTHSPIDYIKKRHPKKVFRQEKFIELYKGK